MREQASKVGSNRHAAAVEHRLLELGVLRSVVVVVALAPSPKSQRTASRA